MGKASCDDVDQAELHRQVVRIQRSETSQLGEKHRRDALRPAVIHAVNDSMADCLERRQRVVGLEPIDERVRGSGVIAGGKLTFARSVVLDVCESQLRTGEADPVDLA